MSALHNRRPTDFLVFCIFFVSLLSAMTAQAQKVWESDQPVYKRVGQVNVHMEKNFARNAEPGDFFVSATDSQTSTSGIFRGVCSEVVAVNISLSDGRKVDMNKFAKSRRGTDLPIDATLDAMRQSLVEQCDQLQVIRLNFSAINEHKQNYSYAGTLTKANGWRLQDGKITTDYDSAYVFTLQMRSPFSPAGVQYQGGCEKEPALLLEPLYQNNTERAAAKPISMSDYVFIAKKISTAYSNECYGVTQIRYALNPMPDDYLCKTDGDCFMDAKLNSSDDDPWNISIQQFKLKEYYHPIGDANDMFEVLAAGRFDILKDYDGFFRFYFENWFGAYSDMCKAQIQNPIGRKIQVVERTYDNGVLVDEEFGPERLIWVEGAYAKDYDRYFGSAKPWATAYVLKKVMKQQDSVRGSVNAVFSGFGFLTSTINQLEEITRGNCSSDKLVTAQTNMINYARQQPAAITDKYPTDKKPLIKYGKNGPSAPEFTSRIQQERRQDKAIRQKNKVETTRQWQQRQAKIQQEIQQRNQHRNTPSQPAVPGTKTRGGSPAEFESRNQLIQDQQARVSTKMQEFQQRMMQAGNSGERQAIQEEMQTYFANIKQQLQQELMEFDQRQR